MSRIDQDFITYVAEIIARTSSVLTAPTIFKVINKYCVEHDIEFNRVTKTKNNRKDELLAWNLAQFDGEEQYSILLMLLDEYDPRHSKEDANKIRSMMITKYSEFAPELESDVDVNLVEEVRELLKDYPKAKTAFDKAIALYESKTLQRNLLDELRFSLEQLLQQIFANGKSLENQKSEIGNLLKGHSLSPFLSNMFVSLLGYYKDFQNSSVKHNDKVNGKEIEFVIDLTSAMMRFLIRLVS